VLSLRTVVTPLLCGCRYPGQTASIELAVLAAVKEQLNRRQPPENITRNFLRLLSATAGLVEVSDPRWRHATGTMHQYNATSGYLWLPLATSDYL
jgi:hypothetical protein